MASEIQESPLFCFQIGPRQLWATLWSLESLLSGQDDQNPDGGPGLGTSIHEQPVSVEHPSPVHSPPCLLNLVGSCIFKGKLLLCGFGGELTKIMARLLTSRQAEEL